MPVKPCHEKGKPGYQAGPTGKCYTYTPGNERGRKLAKAKADRQLQAIEASKHAGGR